MKACGNNGFTLVELMAGMLSAAVLALVFEYVDPRLRADQRRHASLSKIGVEPVMGGDNADRKPGGDVLMCY